MAYNYRVCKKVDKTKPEKQVRYYAVPVSSKLISVKRLSRIISDRCSLTGSDVVACIDALADVILLRVAAQAASVSMAFTCLLPWLVRPLFFYPRSRYCPGTSQPMRPNAFPKDCHFAEAVLNQI
jgi:hypothetical protein